LRDSTSRFAIALPLISADAHAERKTVDEVADNDVALELRFVSA